MRQKVFIILALFYSVQFIISCCPSETFKQTITGVTTRTLQLDTNRFSFIEVTDQQTIDKEDLIIEVLFQGTNVQVANLMRDFGKLGMQSTYAAIDCEDATIVYVNSVQTVEIIAIDVNGFAETDVTDDLVIQGGDQSIADYISNNILSVFDGFVVEFSDVSNVPTQATFRIRATLDDNTVIETTTNQVNFN